MKTAVVGCGAVGSYYGALLCRDGNETHFLLRSDYDIVRRRGVSIKSPNGDFNARPRCARDPREIGVCDLVLIGLKTTANDRLPDLLPPLVDKHTAVVALQNGLGTEAEIEKLIPSNQILGGLCFVCLNRTAPGIIHHIAHGKIVMGEYKRWPEPRTHDLCTLFKHAGIPCRVADNLEHAHWEKLVWNIPFNGLGVAASAGYDACIEGRLNPDRPRGPALATDALLKNPKWEKLVRELMMEIIMTANRLKFPIPESYAERNIERTRVMGAYRASTLIDFERGQPLELENLFLIPRRQAREAGVKTPRLDGLCDILSALNPK